ncbi:MAG: hypothetical protein WCF04_09665 [Candidatus Nanopelagicales bacterium]
MPRDPGGALRRLLEAITYRVRLVLLSAFGPATLDDEHDPIVALRRDHQHYLSRG